jgi:hypothetical protein
MPERLGCWRDWDAGGIGCLFDWLFEGVGCLKDWDYRAVGMLLLIGLALSNQRAAWLWAW